MNSSRRSICTISCDTRLRYPIQPPMSFGVTNIVYFGVTILLTTTLISRRKVTMNLPIVLALGALVGFGLSNFFWKISGINRVFPPSFMIVESLCVLLVAIVIHLIQKQPFSLSPRMAGIASLAGLSAGLAIFATMTAFRLGGEASIVSPITGLGFVVAVLLAYLLLRESITMAKLVGFGLAVAAIFVLAR